MATAFSLAACAGSGETAVPPEGNHTAAPSAPEGESPSAPPDTSRDGSDEPGEPELSAVTVAVPFPDAGIVSYFLVGDAQGYYADEGIDVEVVTADDVVAAVSSGSADLGIVSAGAPVDAITKGLGVEIIAGHYCRNSYTFAVQPDIESVEDLDGAQVVLSGTAGDPQQFARRAVLAQEGWDLDTVDVEVVYPGPNSATWREFFVAGRVALTPFYPDDALAMEQYGASVPVDEIRNWPAFVSITRDGWVQDHPDTAVRFLRATMRGAQFMTAPAVGEPSANKDRILEIYRDNDFETASYESTDGPYALSQQSMCPNLYFDEDAWKTTIEMQELEPVDFEAGTDLSALERAQSLLGTDNSPPTDLAWPAS